MKKACLLIIIALLALSTQAQDYTPKWGPPCYDEEGIIIPPRYRFLGIADDHYYMMVSNRTENLLLRYDLNHQKIGQQKIDLTYNDKMPYFHRFTETQSGHFLILKHFDSDTKEVTILTSKLEQGKLTTPKKIHSHISKHSGKLILFLNMTYNNTHSHIVTSQDKSKVAISTVAHDKYDLNKLKQSIVVFDENLNLLWDKIHPHKYDGENLKIKQVKVNNKGEVYVFTRFRDPESMNLVLRLPKFAHVLFKMTKDKHEEFRFKTEKDYAVSNARIYLLNELEQGKDFVIAGFYLYKTTPWNQFGGVFMGYGNDQEGFTDYQLHPADKKNHIDNNYKIKQLLRLENGTYALISEILEVTIIESEISSSRKTFETNSLLITHFTIDGNLLHSTTIDKRYQNSNLGMLSYFATTHNNKIYFIFNNRKSAKERRALKKQGNGSFLYTDFVVFNAESGEIEFNDIFINYKQSKLTYGPGLVDFENGQLLIGTRMKGPKKYTFTIMDLE